MRKLLGRIAPLAAIALFAFSCAEKSDESYPEFEQASLDAWMQKYVNDRGVRAVKQPNGMYVELTEPGTGSQLLKFDTSSVWIRYNFTARDLHNNVALTRLEKVARQQGTFTRYTHYCPDYIYCGPVNTNLLEGTYYVLRNILTGPDGKEYMLRVGSKATLYIPSQLAYGAYGTSNSAGYGGQYSLQGDRPAILDMEIVAATSDPSASEQTQVRHFVDREPDRWELLNKDSANYLYVNKRFRLPEGEQSYRGDSIGKDTTVKIWYVGRFLDGFVFDTNIDSVKRRVYGEVLETGEALSFKASDSGYIDAWTYSIPHLLQGQWAELLCTSNYAYGAQGKQGSATTSGGTANNNYYYDYYNYYNNYYSGYYNDYYYNNYYNNYLDYYNYYNTPETTPQTTTVTTEIQSYTPLLFEIYIESNSSED